MEANDAIPPEVLADLDQVCRLAASGGVADPELLRRIQERSRRAREEVFRRNGVLDIGTQIIRDLRDGTDE